MSTTSKHLPAQQRDKSSGLRIPGGDRPAKWSRVDSRQPLLDGRIQAPSRPISVMGPPNRPPGIGVMGGPDRGPRVDVMGGPDRGRRLDVMGGPDRGPRVDVMGESFPRFVDALFTGQTKSIDPC